MLPRNVYNERSGICAQCEWFHRMRCRKGHVPTSSTGCPAKKFPPINGADYDPDREPTPLEEPVSDCCEHSRNLQNVTWPQVLAMFTKAMVKWAKAGLPLAPAALHGQRLAKCEACIHRTNYYCTKCKCICYLKCKVATEQCPDNPPRWRSA